MPLSEDQGLSPTFIKVADAATRPDIRQSAALSTAWFARSTGFTLVTIPAKWWQAVEWRTVAIDGGLLLAEEKVAAFWKMGRTSRNCGLGFLSIIYSEALWSLWPAPGHLVFHRERRESPAQPTFTIIEVNVGFSETLGAVATDRLNLRHAQMR